MCPPRSDTWAMPASVSMARPMVSPELRGGRLPEQSSSRCLTFIAMRVALFGKPGGLTGRTHRGLALLLVAAALLAVAVGEFVDRALPPGSDRVAGFPLGSLLCVAEFSPVRT